MRADWVTRSFIYPLFNKSLPLLSSFIFVIFILEDVPPFGYGSERLIMVPNLWLKYFCLSKFFFKYNLAGPVVILYDSVQLCPSCIQYGLATILVAT